MDGLLNGSTLAQAPLGQTLCMKYYYVLLVSHRPQVIWINLLYTKWPQRVTKWSQRGKKKKNNTKKTRNDQKQTQNDPKETINNQKDTHDHEIIKKNKEKETEWPNLCKMTTNT